jgi:hypothetical protein
MFRRSCVAFAPSFIDRFQPARSGNTFSAMTSKDWALVKFSLEANSAAGSCTAYERLVAMAILHPGQVGV